jgi:hypothetical protein
VIEKAVNAHKGLPSQTQVQASEGAAQGNSLDVPVASTSASDTETTEVPNATLTPATLSATPSPSTPPGLRPSNVEHSVPAYLPRTNGSATTYAGHESHPQSAQDQAPLARDQNIPVAADEGEKITPEQFVTIKQILRHAVLQDGKVYLRSCSRVLIDGVTICGRNASPEGGDPADLTHSPFLDDVGFGLGAPQSAHRNKFKSNLHQDTRAKGPWINYHPMSYKDAMKVLVGEVPDWVMIKTEHGEVPYNDWRSGFEPYPSGMSYYSLRSSTC